MDRSFETVLHGVAEPTAELRELISASQRLTARLARRLEMNASDAQALYLLQRNGRMGVAELARELGMRAASATVLVDRLERAGHAVRERDPEDRRRVWVSATPAATEAILPVWVPSIDRLDAVGRALDPGERDVVVRYLRAVREAVDASE
jgi:DNA-binding MarR family transcriptional regulator